MKVTVWMTAYNHGKFIAQCLDSVLAQKTDFGFDIVLGEDCSSDNTRKIVLDYAQRFPGRFKLFLPEQNIGMMEMDVATHRMCTGKYLALLNGDDYWTDENKLQTQADFLDSNEDSVMCYHKATVVNDETGESFETVYVEDDDELRPEALLRGYNPVMTPTVMMRNVLELPAWYEQMPYGDMLTYLLLTRKGRIRYIDRNMSTYRVHGSGQWQGDSMYRNLLKDLKFYTKMNAVLDFKYDREVRRIFSQRYFDLVLFNVRKNDIEQAKRFYKKLISNDLEFISKRKRDVLRLYAILFENADTGKHADLINSPIKWNVTQP